jgi:hypothetical protein
MKEIEIIFPVRKPHHAMLYLVSCGQIESHELKVMDFLIELFLKKREMIRGCTNS